MLSTVHRIKPQKRLHWLAVIIAIEVFDWRLILRLRPHMTSQITKMNNQKAYLNKDNGKCYIKPLFPRQPEHRRSNSRLRCHIVSLIISQWIPLSTHNKQQTMQRLNVTHIILSRSLVKNKKLCCCRVHRDRATRAVPVDILTNPHANQCPNAIISEKFPNFCVGVLHVQKCQNRVGCLLLLSCIRVAQREQFWVL